MKILVFSPYYPPHIGGLETHSDEFNKYLSQKGADITVFTPRLPTDAPKNEMQHGTVTILRFPAIEIVSGYPLPKFWHPSFWAIFLSLFKEHPDFVISRTRFFLSSFIALVFAKITRTKLVHIEHGSDFVKLSSRFKTLVAKIYDYTLGFLVFRCSDINISISGAVQEFVRKFDSRPSPIIYRGIDFEAIEKAGSDGKLRKKFPGKIILCTTGRLYKWKGVENTIRAVKNLPEEIKMKIVFVIVGDGEDYKRLKDLSDDSVVMLGSKPRNEVFRILHDTDIYIHSSFPGGGLSTSLLEAMVSGCTVIATPNEGADEIVENGKNGILLDGSSPENIREAIISLTSQEELRRKLGKQGKNDVRIKFSWEKSISQYFNIFNSL